MAPPKKILLLTNSEHGQANVIIAVAHELLVRAETEVHIASFSPLKPRITELQTGARQDVGSVTFHTVDGLSMTQIGQRSNHAVSDGAHPPRLKGALLGYARIAEFVYGWDGPEYIESYKSCLDIIEKVDPALILVDPLFSQGRDACWKSDRKHVILSPNSLKDLVGAVQPKMAMFWKYPASSSGYPYPLPRYRIPANIYLLARSILAIILSSRFRMITKHRKDNGVTTPLGLMKPYEKHIQMICPSLPEIEFPMTVPSNVTPCGPILLPTKPLSEADPGLASWLQRGPTILVNLGSHWIPEVASACEMARAFGAVLNRHQDLQVLWKLKQEKDIWDRVTEILHKEITSTQVRVEKWLIADPPAILQSGNVICSVHHGGANSFFEAVLAAVPQVVLPIWYDTYDFAVRAEWLGVGLYGNPSVAPQVDAAEFGKALNTIVGDGKGAEQFRARAETLAGICREAGGRVHACDKIMEMIRDVK